MKIIFSLASNKLSNVKKTYIDIIDEQKLELQIKKKVAFSAKLNIVFAMRVFVRETD